MTPADAATRYWRLCCALAATHLFGLTWPPPGIRQRRRVVGHWGCNPGIAWIVGHIAANHGDGELLVVVGTGHASSFLFAHEALASQASAAAVSQATRYYGQANGEPSELVGLPEVPYLGGELGPTLAVTQGIAAATDRTVVAIIGDGECETPVALAAFAHVDVLLRGTGATWLPVVNVNGARMGGAARFDANSLERLLSGLDYTVLRSGTNESEAAEAARRAIEAAREGVRVAWLSESEKGWPAPETITREGYRGHRAHKAAGIDLDQENVATVITEWITQLASHDALGADGRVADDIAALARRASLRLPRKAMSSSAHVEIPAPLPGTSPGWRRPIERVDAQLAARAVLIFSPDEAASNRLHACIEAGLVREVLAEEVCFAWAWGSVEAGRPAAFVSYEAFAPLVSTQLAQYTKILVSRPPCSRPPLVVLLSSLGWANSPTHQNGDLITGMLSRPVSQVRVVLPIGAGSAERRTASVLESSDQVALVVSSKQRLLDLPDPGSPIVRLWFHDAAVQVTLVAMGDVAVTECVAAMMLASLRGVCVEVYAVVEPTAARGRLADGLATQGKTFGFTCLPASAAEPIFWRLFNHVFPVAGYAERWGATAWETLRANGLDRISVLRTVARGCCDLPFEELNAVDAAMSTAELDSVPQFKCHSIRAEAVKTELG